MSRMIKNSFVTGYSQVQPGASSNSTRTKCHFVPRYKGFKKLI